MENNLFLGLKPYQSDESEYLPSRADDVRMLSMMLETNTVSILTGDPKCGKTSLINAVASPQRLSGRAAVAIRFSVPQFRFGDLVLEKQIAHAIAQMCQKPTYLDLAFDDDQTLWYASKKIQAAYPDAKRFYLILDDFCNIFTYGAAARREVATAISTVIYGNVPNHYAAQIQKIMMGESDIVVPSSAMPLLLDSPKFSVLFSVGQPLYNQMAQFNDIIRGILQNTMTLAPFDMESATMAAPVIASQPLDGLPPVTLDDQAVKTLVSHFAMSGGTICPGLLRSAIFRLRASMGSFGNITAQHIQQSGILSQSPLYEALSSIQNPDERQQIIRFVKTEMRLPGETQPLPAYRGIATGRYDIQPDTLQLMQDLYVLRATITDDARVYYLPFSQDVFRQFLSMEVSGGGLLEEAPMPQPLASLDQQPRSQRSRLTKPFIYACAVVAMVSMAFVFLAFQLKDDAERHANAAKSNMLSAFAFQKLETDPTFSLRLAQQAVGLDSANTQAYSALLNSFYNTDIFYNISGRYTDNIVRADIEPSCQYVLTYVKSAQGDHYAARILSPEGDVMLEIPHTSEVTSISMSRLHDRIITTSYDSVARIFDINGKLLHTISSHPAILWSAAISPDGKYIATAGSDGCVMLWDSAYNAAATFRGHDFDVYCVAFSPDGNTLLSSSGDNTARLWSIGGRQHKTIEIREDNRFSMSLISQAVFSPCGKYILLAANDYLNKNHKARLMDLDGNELTSFAGHGDWINSVQFSPDGKHVITSSRDKVVRVFGIKGNIEKVLKGHNSNVWASAYAPDGNTILTVGDDHTIRTWSIGKRFETYDNARNVSFAGFSPDGLKIMVVQDTMAQAWDLTGEVMASFVGHKQAVNTARFSRDGRKVVTTSEDSTTRVWSCDGALLSVIKHSDRVNDAVFSPDGKFVVSVSSDSSIVIRDLVTDIDVVSKGSHRGSVTSVAFAPDAQVFATGGSDGKVILHEIGGRVIRIFNGHDGRVNSVAFSPDGASVISTSSDETAVLWDMLGQMKFTFRGYENKVNSAVFSPDGKYIVTTSDDGSARLWTTDGKDLMDFHHDGQVRDAVFSPDGKYILTVYRNERGLKTIKLRMLSPDGITRHIDQLDLYGTVWQPDAETMKKYGVGE